VEEARRVAALAVVKVLPPQTGRSNGSGQLQSTISGGRLCAEWQTPVEDSQSTPSVSIIIPVYNNSGYTANCLEQLRRTVSYDLCDEVIVVDDASTDDTESLLGRWAAEDRRIKSIRNESNLGFIHSCNRGAKAATGDVLVFLNNDTLPQDGWLPPLVQVLQEQPKAGAVGGKLIYPNGTLQEAGGIIFTDGTGCNYGRNSEIPNSPLFNFLREVDYCSGALLATPRKLFLNLKGFDSYFAPAYYEDTDYCFRLREKGFRVFYQPESVIIHFEGVSSGTSIDAGIKSYQEINRLKFIERWKQVLKRQPKPRMNITFRCCTPCQHVMS
jgi:GT2 family glycosyltransferase